MALLFLHTQDLTSPFTACLIPAVKPSVLYFHIWPRQPLSPFFLRHQWGNPFLGTQWNSFPYVLSQYIKEQGSSLQSKLLPGKVRETGTGRGWPCVQSEQSMGTTQWICRTILSEKCIIIYQRGEELGQFPQVTVSSKGLIFWKSLDWNSSVVWNTWHGE